MQLKDIIVQLESIRANSASFIDLEEPYSIWKQDIESLDGVIIILKRMEQKRWWNRILVQIRRVFARRIRWIGGILEECLTHYILEEHPEQRKLFKHIDFGKYEKR